MEQRAATYIQVFPIAAEAGESVTPRFGPLLPWGTPAYGWLEGTSAGGEPMVTIGTEWPLIWLRTVDKLSKYQLEEICLRRFSADQALAWGTHAFGPVKPGANPPDAVVQTQSRTIGVEHTAVTIEDRREAHGIFLALRRHLQAAEPAVFARLARHFVYVWFLASEGEGPLTRPHTRSDDAALGELVQALATYEPDTDALRIEGQPPAVMPEIPWTDTSAGARFYAVPLLGGVAASMLYTAAGFDIALVYSTKLTASGAWAEIQRLVDKHDQSGVDLLLMTAGAPDANGNIFPAEEVLANFLLAHPTGLIRAPDHIADVTLHSWATGRATRLYPAVEPLWGPLYSSFVPMHHPVAGPAS